MEDRLLERMNKRDWVLYFVHILISCLKFSCLVVLHSNAQKICLSCSQDFMLFVEQSNSLSKITWNRLGILWSHSILLFRFKVGLD